MRLRDRSRPTLCRFATRLGQFSIAQTAKGKNRLAKIENCPESVPGIRAAYHFRYSCIENHKGAYEPQVALEIADITIGLLKMTYPWRKICWKDIFTWGDE